MVYKLHGSPTSTCTQRVLVVAKELSVDIEVVVVNSAAGENKSKEYIETKQPFGQVPVLEDDGFFLYESRAIARYLASKHKSKLLPNANDDLKAYALFEQAASNEYSNFDPYASGTAAQRVFHPGKGIPTNEEHAKFLLSTLEYKLDGYERILSKQKYIAGDELTLADLYHLPYGTFITNRLGLTVLTSESRPNVARWWKSIYERPSWVAVRP